ncbi:MAG: hypothetical protein U9532_02300 ['Conium maculatum' witches'-broom phytoplasma]|nr:hypothetical protein ['Conium maculatum' witches'-broom phytoplasma]
MPPPFEPLSLPEFGLGGVFSAGLGCEEVEVGEAGEEVPPPFEP